MKEYKYTTQDGFTFIFTILKENKKSVTIFVKDYNKIYNISKDELKRAKEVN